MRRGVSLIEGMAALAILLVGLGGMAIAYQKHIYQTVSARNMTMAAMVAQSVLAELDATEPANWDLAALEAQYAYTFDGDRVPADDTAAYYLPRISQTVREGWRQVSIAVVWEGWKTEGGKSGFFNASDNFAYVLEVNLSPNYGFTHSD